MALCKTLYRNSAVRDISHKFTGATGILLFYSWLKTKQWKIQPNKNTAFCSCLATEVMGKEVIEAAKAVVIKKSQSSVVQDDENLNGRLRKLEEKQDSLQVQLTDLSAKLDTILNVIQNK